LLSEGSKYAPLYMREIVGADRPMIFASTLFLISSRSAARSAALVTTFDASAAPWSRALGLGTMPVYSYRNNRILFFT
jgi:hypothetical protein